MTTVKLREIIDALDAWAPPRLAAKWDNCGLQLGHPDHDIHHILISLDLDDNALNYIQGHPVDLVVTHHPLFFRPIKSIWFQSDLARTLQTLLNAHVHMFTMHTNLDATQNGVTDALIRAYGFDPSLAHSFSDSCCKYLLLPDGVPLKFLQKKQPSRIFGDTAQTVFRKLAFCGGSGGSFLEEAFRLGVDCFITGEINYHQRVYCAMNNITCLALGHKESEQFVLPVIQTYLQDTFSDLDVVVGCAL